MQRGSTTAETDCLHAFIQTHAKECIDMLILELMEAAKLRKFHLLRCIPSLMKMREVQKSFTCSVLGDETLVRIHEGKRLLLRGGDELDQSLYACTVEAEYDFGSPLCVAL